MAFKDYKNLPYKKKNTKEIDSFLIKSLFFLILFSLFLFLFSKKVYHFLESSFSSNNFFYQKALGQTIIQNLSNDEPKFYQKWKFIVIHHSAIEIGNAKIYNEYHQEKYKQNLLYHFIIGNGTASKDGEIEISDRWSKQLSGRHVSVSNDLYNKKGIGICLVGNFDKTKPSKNQLNQLILLTKFLMKRFNIPIENVLLHNQVNTTKCPGNLFPKDLFYSSLE